MAGRFVRASKYRHVFGQTTRREQCYDNLRISKNAWDTNLIKANPKYLAVNWEAGGGGAFAVIPLEERGKEPEQIPLFRGHTAVVLDTDWSPFNDQILASASDDGKVFLWQVPEDFTLRTDADEPEDVKPVGKLSGHSRKVGHVLFNPAAENVLASASGDYTVKIWDLEDGKAKLTLKGNDIFTSLSWSADGSTLVTTSRDKKLRFWDVRQERPAYEGPGHSGAKNSRVTWLGDLDRVVTTGFSKMSERQIGLWDTRNPGQPIHDFRDLDSGSGVLMPFWDDGCQILYLAGKGDGNIRYYELQNDKFEDLAEYRSTNPQRGVAFVPKRGVNTHENEVMRAFKTVDDAYIEPVSFIVPRRSETFQEDIYPPTIGTQPATSSSEWFGGKTALPPKFSMEDIYEHREPTMVSAAAAVSKPSATISAPAPTPASAPVAAAPKAQPQPEPIPAASAAREMPSVKDNQKSMADIASRYADPEPAAADDDSDDFEEIQKPVDRTSVIPTRQTSPSFPTKLSTASNTSLPTPPATATPAATAAASSSAAAFSGETLSGSPATATSEPASALRERAATGTSGAGAGATTSAAAAGGLRDVLQEIRGMLQAQGKQIELLTNEVAGLKAKVGE